MRLLVWLFRAFIFFTLFAFALNNQQVAVVHWFFGVEWRTPMVIVVTITMDTGRARRTSPLRSLAVGRKLPIDPGTGG